MQSFINHILHLDQYVPHLMQQYGNGVYAILFLIIFCETGLVIFPFLPGDSLLFACGALTVSSSLNLWSLYILFVIAAFVGDSANYWIGREWGRKIFRSEDSKIFKKSHLEKTEQFFEKYGDKAIILARFVPIVRTFAPFVAGMGRMHFARFMTYNLIGGVLWVGILVTMGRLVGQLHYVKDHFAIVEIVIVLLSLVPVIYEYAKHKRDSKH